MKTTLLICLGILIGVILDFFFGQGYNPSFQRKCRNCKYCIPSYNRNRQIKLYCNLPSLHNLDTYPINDIDVCGHFEFTEQLKAEQIRINAEKYVKK